MIPLYQYLCVCMPLVRPAWSLTRLSLCQGLVTNYGEGGLQNGRGGGATKREGKFYPYEKGGQKKF